MRNTGKNCGLGRAILFGVYLSITVFAVWLTGCMKAPGILDQEPVIPLTGSPQVKDEDTYPSLHLSGDAEAPGDRAQGSIKQENAEDAKNAEETKYAEETKNTADTKNTEVTENTAETKNTEKTNASEETKDTAETEDAGEADDTEETNDTAETKAAGDSIRNGDYQVEGVQLSGKQLEKMSAYFNLRDVNPYLQQVYLIPEDFDKEAENIPVNITCVAGSYDSNRLYSIFYKKEGSNALWNVIMRRRDPGQDKEDGDYRFHSNRLLDPNGEEMK